MSYIESPRFVFAGRFQADVSTVNNDVRHYDNATWRDSFQDFMQRESNGTLYNGWWNPDGTGSFRLLDVAVAGAESGQGGSADDPVLTLRVESNIDIPPAKLVDLDPQFQMGSMIFGLQMVFTDGTTEYFRGDFEPAPFRDLFFTRVNRAGGSGNASAKFTSLLINLRWNDSAPRSALLTSLRESADANGGCLSVNLMTFAYNTGVANPTFTLGRIVGAVGPWREGDPKSFTAGRRFAPVVTAQSSPFGTQQDNIGFFDAVIRDGRLNADLGNALPLSSLDGAVAITKPLQLVVLKAADEIATQDGVTTLTPGCAEGAAVTADDYVAVGPIDCAAPGWLAKTAGLVSFPVDGDTARLAESRPLALVITDGPDAERVAIRETVGGYFVRADDFEHRVDAEAGRAVEVAVGLHCLRFGAPLQGAKVQVQLAPPDPGEGGTGDPNELDPPAAPIPVINVPATAIRIDAGKATGADGIATATIQVDDPKNFRKYIEGQIFTLPYQFGFSGESAMPLFEQILLHVRDAFDAPLDPQWESDVEPVLVQFGNLYPIMSRGLFSFSDPEVVAEHARIMSFALTRHLADPNHMPVTRDMSAGKREMVLRWLAGKSGAAPPAPKPIAASLAPARGVATALPPAEVGGPLPAGYARFSRMKGLPTEIFEEAAAAPEAPQASPSADSDGPAKGGDDA